MNPQPTDNPKEHLLRLLPPFRETVFGRVTGWSDLLIDAGLDLYSLGRRRGVTLTCHAAMADNGRLELTCLFPPSLREEGEAILIRLGEETGKLCQYCGKQARPTQNRRGEVRTLCPACLSSTQPRLEART